MIHLNAFYPMDKYMAGFRSKDARLSAVFADGIQKRTFTIRGLQTIQ